MRSIILFLFLTNLTFAQLGLKEAEIIKEQGSYWKREVENGFVNLYYKSLITDKTRQSLAEVITYKINTEDNKCDFVIYAYPISAENKHVKLLNKIAVPKSENLWYDYGNNSYYKLFKNESFVSIEHGYIELQNDQFQECESEKEKLNLEIANLKKNNKDLIEAMKKLIEVGDITRKNLEKAKRKTILNF